jgi:hypothetical protein
MENAGLMFPNTSPFEQEQKLTLKRERRNINILGCNVNAIFP